MKRVQSFWNQYLKGSLVFINTKSLSSTPNNSFINAYTPLKPARKPQVWYTRVKLKSEPRTLYCKRFFSCYERSLKSLIYPSLSFPIFGFCLWISHKTNLWWIIFNLHKATHYLWSQLISTHKIPNFFPLKGCHCENWLDFCEFFFYLPSFS